MAFSCCYCRLLLQETAVENNCLGFVAALVNAANICHSAASAIR